MGQSLSAESVNHWLDRGVIENVEQRDVDGALFSFHVTYLGAAIDDSRYREDGPLHLLADFDVDATTLALFEKHPRERRVAFTQLAIVLTNTPGFYAPVDDDGQVCKFEEMRSISLEHWIHPDEATQHKLMNRIIDMGMALVFIDAVIRRFKENIDNQR